MNCHIPLARNLPATMLCPFIAFVLGDSGADDAG